MMIEYSIDQYIRQLMILIKQLNYEQEKCKGTNSKIFIDTTYEDNKTMCEEIQLSDIKITSL